MPQEIDGSGLISVLWAAWVFWNIYWCLEHLSTEQADEKRPAQRYPFSPPGDATTIPPSTATALSPNLEAVVSEILRRDGAGSIEDFLRERLATYEAVVAAFDSGDLRFLRKLVSPVVYSALLDAIEARESLQLSVETVFSRIGPPEIVDGLIDEEHMEISVRFVGECFKLFRGTAGGAIEGTPEQHLNIDIWTFAQTLPPREREWRVVATEAGV